MLNESGIVKWTGMIGNLSMKINLFSVLNIIQNFISFLTQLIHQ